jgi:hypothetical protein
MKLIGYVAGRIRHGARDDCIDLEAMVGDDEDDEDENNVSYSDTVSHLPFY